MNASYYVNMFHAFELMGKYFVFLTHNLHLFETDADTYKLLKIVQENSLREVNDYASTEDIIALREAGILTQEDSIQDEFQLINDSRVPTQDIKGDNTLLMTNIVLELANDCNLNCIYCYGSGGSYGRKRELMSFDVAKKAVDLLIANSGESQELLVTLFGGEPLLNFDVLVQTIEYCKSQESKVGKKFRYNMTTNGTIMSDKVFSFLKDNRISTMISIDGSQSIQDTHRPYEFGGGTYSTVLSNIHRFKEINNGHLTARATICRPNTNLSKIREDLLSLGFTRVLLSIVDTDSGSELFLGGEYSIELRRQYLHLADAYIKSIQNTGKSDYDHFDSIIRNLYFKQMTIRSCNAGKNGFAIGSNGNIYPCHRFMGMDEYIIGSVYRGIEKEQTAGYEQANVLYKSECRKCWAKYLCGGGCLHTCVIQENDIMREPKCYCDTYRFIYELSLYIYATLREWNGDVFNEMYKEVDAKITTIK